MTDKSLSNKKHVLLQVFNVKAAKTESVSDASYTTDDLLLHSDQNYFESSPGIQILFCMQ